MDAYELDKYVAALEEKVEWLLQTLLIDAMNYPYDVTVGIPHPEWLLKELAFRWYTKEQPIDGSTETDYLDTLREITDAIQVHNHPSR